MIHTENITETDTLLRINPRDELPLFEFPGASAFGELNSLRDDGTMKLPVAVGMDEGSSVKIIDLADSPNLLIAGSRVCYDSIVQSLKTVIYSLLMTRHPSEVKLVMMDAHGLDFMDYDQLADHYLACLTDADNSIVSSSRDSSNVMASLLKEIEDRLKLFQKVRCRNFAQYNEKYCQGQLLQTEGYHFLPYIVVVANEYAEFLPLTKPYKQSYLNQLIRVARIGKTAGIHLVFGTTYLMKDLLPRDLVDDFLSIMAYKVNSKNESKMLLMDSGPEALRDTRSFIFRDYNLETYHLRGLDIRDDEFDRVVEGIGMQRGYQRSYSTPYYLPDPWAEYEDDCGGEMLDMKQLDERFEECARLVVSMKRASTPDLQRRLGMGYAKAGRVMDQLEAAGIVGPQNGSKPREVLVKDLNELDQILSAIANGE